jgi:GDPmannose 4,6-dehydratase
MMVMSGERVLITGVSGFVGSRLAKRLVDLGYEIYGFVRRRAEGRNYKRLVEAGVFKEVRFLEGDISDLSSILFALDRSEPDIIFHLASQSFVPRSFENPLETFYVNSLGTQNLLEAVRLKDLDSIILFAGSSEEYGLQIASENHYKKSLEKFKFINPEPVRIPELPIGENNPLRPLSPYAVSKVHGDLLMRVYHQAYGLKTIVSRAFNHEGAGRGHHFVTSSIVRQCVSLKFGETDKIVVGNINAFRDWSHVDDIIEGYITLVEKGSFGEVYVLGSERTNSVLTYLLLTLEELGYKIFEIETFRNNKRIKDPVERDHKVFFGKRFEKTKIDVMMLNEEIEFSLEDEGIFIKTDKGSIRVVFDPKLFRPIDVPILLSDVKKASEKIGFKVVRSLSDIIKEQISYYLNPFNRAV